MECLAEGLFAKYCAGAESGRIIYHIIVWRLVAESGSWGRVSKESL